MQKKNQLPHKRQVDTVNSHMVTGNTLPGCFSATINCDGSWNVTDRHTVAVFLDFHLIKSRQG